jgi:hypothetical protein
MHIPTYEFITVYNEFETYGIACEEIACPLEGPDLVSALIEMEVSALIVGHNHKNDYGGTYMNKIDLIFGRKSGYGGYKPCRGVVPGGRVYEFNYDIKKQKVSMNHYVYDYDGNIFYDIP